MHLLNKEVYFWHWNKEPMSVLCRLDEKMVNLFKNAPIQDELMKLESTETINQGTITQITERIIQIDGSNNNAMYKRTYSNEASSTTTP